MSLPILSNFKGIQYNNCNVFQITVEAAEGRLDLCRRRLHAQSEKVKVHVEVCDHHHVPKAPFLSRSGLGLNHPGWHHSETPRQVVLVTSDNYVTLSTTDKRKCHVEKTVSWKWASSDLEFLLSDVYLTVAWKYQQNDRRAMLGQGLVWSRPLAAAAATNLSLL